MCFKLTKLEVSDHLFIISKIPDPSNILSYRDQLINHKIQHLVRVCDCEYDKDIMLSCGVNVTDIPIKDGNVPTKNDIDKWMKIVNENKRIAIHCVSGLGRAPMLVAIAMIRMAKINSIDAITILREQIKGCLNTRQITYVFKLDSDRCCIM